MDHNRYKKSLHKQPVKPTLNNDTMAQPKPFSSRFGKKKLINSHKPTVISPSNRSQPAVRREPELPALFDDDDDDLFGVWKKQAQIKKARLAEEAAERAAKKAAKLAKKRQKLARQARAEATGVHEVAISLTMPRFTIPSLRDITSSRAVKHIKANKRPYLTAAVILAVPLTFISIGLYLHNASANKNKTTEVLGTAVAKPDFSTLTPTGGDGNQPPAQKYDPSKKVASYNDTLDATPITVSEQPLPSSFKADPTGSVANLAKQINANDKISTSDVTAFAGLSIKGPQTVVFTKNDLLIFIVADKKIDPNSWSKYIGAMK